MGLYPCNLNGAHNLIAPLDLALSRVLLPLTLDPEQWWDLLLGPWSASQTLSPGFLDEAFPESLGIMETASPVVGEPVVQLSDWLLPRVGLWFSGNDHSIRKDEGKHPGCAEARARIERSRVRLHGGSKALALMESKKSKSPEGWSKSSTWRQMIWTGEVEEKRLERWAGFRLWRSYTPS